MKHAYIFGLTVGLLAVTGLVGCQSATDDKNAAADDLGKMAGTWTLVSAEVGGKPLPEAEIKNAKLTIAGDQYTVDLGEQGVKKGVQKLDAKMSPKHIDAHDTEGPTKGDNLGIYEFTTSGDFRVCFAATGKDRPTAFTTTPENGQFIHLWRRAK